MLCEVGFHKTIAVPFAVHSMAQNVTVQVDLSEKYERDARYLPTGRLLSNDPLTPGETVSYQSEIQLEHIKTWLE